MDKIPLAAFAILATLLFGAIGYLVEIRGAQLAGINARLDRMDQRRLAIESELRDMNNRIIRLERENP